MIIKVGDLSEPGVIEFLREHLAEMRAVTPAGSVHALDLEELRAPEITFWTVTDGAAVVGCGAIKRLDEGHAEVKSMRTASSRKRSGLATRLLEHIIAEARARGFTRLSLETGAHAFFEPARRLYQKHGFEHCEPFADYEPDPNSTYMTRAI